MLILGSEGVSSASLNEHHFWTWLFLPLSAVARKNVVVFWMLNGVGALGSLLL